MSIILCPGGEAVYTYTLGSIFPAIITTIIWTFTIVLFALNLRDYLKHKQSSKTILISFVFVIATAIINILTFIYFVHKEMYYPSATAKPVESLSTIGIELFIIIIVGLIICYTYNRVVE